MEMLIFKRYLDLVLVFLRIDLNFWSFCYVLKFYRFFKDVEIIVFILIFYVFNFDVINLG